MPFASLSHARPPRERLLDAAMVLAVAAIAVGLPTVLVDGPPTWSPLAGTAGFVAVAVILRLNSRAAVQLTLAGAAAAGLAALAVLVPGRFATADDLSNVLMALSPVFPLYAAYVYEQDRRRAWVMAASLTIVVVHPWSTSITAASGGLLWVCAPMLFGFYLAARAQYLNTLLGRAENAERERDLLTERARTEERVRLAADLHDVVTHRVSLMVLHAGALRVTAVDATRRDAAEDVRAIGCGALEELRDLIGVLRGTPPAPTGNPAPPADSGSGAIPQRPRIGASDVRVLLAALVWTILLSVVVMIAPSPTGELERPLPWLEVLLQLPAVTALVARRRHPHLVVVITIVDALAMLASALAGPAGWVASSTSTTLLIPAVAPLVTYAVAAYSRRPLLGTVLVLGLTAIAARPWAPHVSVATVAAVFVALPALLGLYVGVRRRFVGALVERADRARRHQRLVVERARVDERVRLAEEMHDIVATSVREMVERADRLGTADGEATDLIATGRQALDELHDLVNALRTAEAESLPSDDDSGGLDRLAAESASVGMPVALSTSGDPARCAPAVARTAHRIVGEGLTNARKHAFGARVRVRVSYGSDRVWVEVVNDAPPASPPTPDRGDDRLTAGGSGTGLLGLRQRVGLVDGTLEAGPTTEGGFAVNAILPGYVPTSNRRESVR